MTDIPRIAPPIPVDKLEHKSEIVLGDEPAPTVLRCIQKHGILHLSFSVYGSAGYSTIVVDIDPDNAIEFGAQVEQAAEQAYQVREARRGEAA